MVLVLFAFSACNSNEKNYDASGSFEAVERIISAEATGKITRLDIEEGQSLEANAIIGQIDVSLLELQSDQVKATIDAIGKKTNDAEPQIKILEAQLITQKSQIVSLEQQMSVLNKEIERFTNLVNAKAAPQKQLDDLKGQQSVLEKQLEAARTQDGVIKEQIESARRNIQIQNRAILSEVEPTKKKLDFIEKQISEGVILNEYPGTVITKYAYDGEFTSIGRPLYKIADLSNIILRAYITGNQLPQIKINEEVTVLTDDGNGGYKETLGIIEWISSKAEFTPKTIQTKNERANMVYAIKVKVKNDGSYKIGMYGEIKFKENV